MKETYESILFQKVFYEEKPPIDYVICKHCGSINLESQTRCNFCGRILILKEEDYRNENIYS